MHSSYTFVYLLLKKVLCYYSLAGLLLYYYFNCLQSAIIQITEFLLLLLPFFIE